MIEFDYWGSPMKLFVADAKYRGFDLRYDAANRSHGNPQLVVTTSYFKGSLDNTAAPLTYTKDDAWIQSTYAALKDDGTAKSNTDLLMGFATTQAAHHRRSQDIPGVGQLDLPNLYEAIILYLESDSIDALDPTAESNRDKALGMMNTGGRFTFGGEPYIWTNTEASDGKFWCIRNIGYAYRGNYMNSYCGVVPVKELDV